MRLFSIFLLLVSSILHSSIYAQNVQNKIEREVKGKLIDSLGLFIPGATIKLTSPQDTLSTSSDNQGEFHFQRVQSPNFELNFYSLGYTPLSRKYQIKETSQTIRLDNITLKEAPIELNTVAVDGGPDVTMNGDTLEYRTRHIQLRENALLEELMKKLSGMRVDMDGNLTINGKRIDKVRINGIDFFGGDVALALSNLPAEMINKLQVIDDYGEEAALTGIRRGEPNKVLNLVVDEDRNKGLFVNSNLAGGTSETFQLEGGGNVFKGSKQLAIGVGRKNTTSDNTLLVGGGSSPGFMARPDGNGVNTLTNGSFHYADKWRSKLDGRINYGLNDNDKLLNSQVYSEQTFSEEQTIRNSTNNLNSDDISHGLFTDFKYRPDSKTTIILSPGFNFSNSTSINESREVLQLFSNGVERSPQIQNTNSINNSKNHRLSGRVSVNRKLDTAGRNIFFTANLNSNGSNGDESQQNQLSFVDLTSGMQRDSLQSQQIYSDNNSLGAAFKLTYTEPLGKKSKLDLTLNQSFNQNHSDRSVYDAFDDSFIDSLSNFTRYNFLESSMEVSYRYQEKKFNYNVGLSGINSHMKGRLERGGKENKRTSFNIAPNINAQWTLPNNQQLRFQYVWRTSEPSFPQLNPVPDRTNPQHVIIGNPNLRTQLNHVGGLMYFGMAPKKEISLRGGLSFRYYQDRVAANTFISYDPKGLLVQETRYENISGDYGLTSDYSLMIPLVKNKYSMDISGNYSWNRSSFFSEQMEQSSNTLNFEQSLSFLVMPADWIYFYPSISYSYEKNRYDSALYSNEPISNLTLKAMGNIRFFQTLVFNGSFNQNFNKGYGVGMNESPTTINLSIENQFFKDRSGVLRLSVNDLLDQNISLNRSISTNSIIDRRENTIGRYLLLSYSQRIGKFK